MPTYPASRPLLRREVTVLPARGERTLIQAVNASALVGLGTNVPIESCRLIEKEKTFLVPAGSPVSAYRVKEETWLVQLSYEGEISGLSPEEREAIVQEVQAASGAQITALTSWISALNLDSLAGQVSEVVSSQSQLAQGISNVNQATSNLSSRVETTEMALSSLPSVEDYSMLNSAFQATASRVEILEGTPIVAAVLRDGKIYLLRQGGGEIELPFLATPPPPPVETDWVVSVGTGQLNIIGMPAVPEIIARVANDTIIIEGYNG